MSNLIAIDCGRKYVKAIAEGAIRPILIPAVVGEYRERRLNNDHGDDIEISYKGDRYFIGKLAEIESDFPRAMMTESKVHEDTRLLILSAICRAGLDGKVKLVTGVPIAQADERDELKELLSGRHDVTFNGNDHSFYIEKVDVAFEGGAAFWSSPRPGKWRIIDAGSKTVNIVTIDEKRYIDRESDTLPFGCDTQNLYDVKALANRIVAEVSKKWKVDDNVLLVGGKANELLPFISRYLRNTEVISDPLYANVRGYYRMGMSLL
jgi:plasmid segregation protein ParM